MTNPNKMWAEKSLEEKRAQLKDGEYLEIDVDGVICHILAMNVDDDNKLHIDWLADGYSSMSDERQEEIAQYIEDACVKILELAVKKD